MGREYRKRVPGERAEYVRHRLLEARLRSNMSLGEAARRIQSERRGQADIRKQKGERLIKSYHYTTTPTDVRRYEGGDKSRRPAPPVEYVEAAAAVYEIDQGWLLGEDDPQLVRRRGLEFLKGSIPRHIQDEIEQRHRICHVLRLASGLPYTPGVVEDRPELEEAHQAIEKLFWLAFGRRGLGFRNLLELALVLGRRIVTPGQLPLDGFRSLSELGPHEYRRFWTLQVLAFETILRSQPELTEEERNLEELRARQEPGRAISWATSLQTWEPRESTHQEVHEAATIEWEKVLDVLANRPMESMITLADIREEFMRASEG